MTKQDWVLLATTGKDPHWHYVAHLIIRYGYNIASSAKKASVTSKVVKRTHALLQQKADRESTQKDARNRESASQSSSGRSYSRGSGNGDRSQLMSQDSRSENGLRCAACDSWQFETPRFGKFSFWPTSADGVAQLK